MFQMLSGLALLGLILLPVFILFIAFCQNLYEGTKPKKIKKQKSIPSNSYYKDTDELPQTRLRVVK